MLSPIIDLSKAKDGYGGKAAGLFKLISYGLPVPKGYALSPEFVDAIFRHPAAGENQLLLSKAIGSTNTRKVAVRSSALNEDGTSNSFAGIYDTFLNVQNEFAEISRTVAQIVRAQDSARASSYRMSRRVEPIEHPHLGIVIQEMISPVIAGVAFSSALGLNGESVMLLECVEGLGDKLVNGEVIPTRIEVPITANGPDIKNCSITGVPLDMTGLGRVIDYVWQAATAANSDLDIEWAIDSEGRAWLLQARPVTTKVLVPAQTDTHSIPASPGLATAATFVVDSEKDLESFPAGSILVAKVTETNYLPAMRRATGVITEEGGILSHAAIVSREIGIPCIVGFADARKRFHTGMVVTIDGSSGIVRDEMDSKGTYSVRRQDVDWGAAYLFENIIPIDLGDRIGLFDPNPTCLALHVPEEFDSEADIKFEIFSRRTFGQSPRRYQSDKYLWYFEWMRFQKNPHFRKNLRASLKAIQSFDSDVIRLHYDSIIARCEKIMELRRTFRDAASRFLVEETLLTCHFLLTMLIPEGYGLRELYSKVVPHLREAGLSFASFLANEVQTVAATYPEMAKISEFSKTVSILRNGIYETLLRVGIMREDYFEDREARAMDALKFLGRSLQPEEDPITAFYSRIEDSPIFHALEVSG